MGTVSGVSEAHATSSGTTSDFSLSSGRQICCPQIPHPLSYQRPSVHMESISSSRAFSGLPTSFPGSSCQSVLSVEELMSLEASLIPEMGPKGQMLLPPIF